MRLTFANSNGASASFRWHRWYYFFIQPRNSFRDAKVVDKRESVKALPRVW